MRLVQIRNQAEPSELIPRYLYEEPCRFEINLFFSLYIYSLILPSEQQQLEG
jgi:hypothetical protein